MTRALIGKTARGLEGWDHGFHDGHGWYAQDTVMYLSGIMCTIRDELGSNQGFRTAKKISGVSDRG
jgi:hypothetical protein